MVRGNNVSIGVGCDIEMVEYKNNLQVAREGKIKDSKKISPE